MALFLFDTEIVLASTLPDNQELALALGNKTIVHWTSSQSLTFTSLSLAAGALPVDKMVVCFSNLNNSGFVQNFVHESGAATNAAFRFRNAGLTTVNGGTGAGAIWYRYFGTQSRWIMIGKTA